MSTPRPPHLIILAVEDGHVATGLKGDGSGEETATCRKDLEQWPCAVIRVARKKHAESLA